MRIIFGGCPLGGHLLPLIPMAFQARELGHEVAILTGRGAPPGTTDLPVLTAGPDIWTVKAAAEEIVGPWKAPGPEAAEMFAGTRVDLSFEDAVAQARAFGPDLVVCEALDCVGRIVASALDIPWASFAISGGLPQPIVEPLAARWDAQLTARQLQAGERACEFDSYPELLHGEAAELAPDRRPVRPMSWGPGLNTPSVFSREAPTVLLTIGTSSEDPTLSHRMARSLSGADLNVVVTHQGEDSDRIRYVGFTALDPLLPQVDAVVSLAGTGTVLAALAAGRPLAMLPMIADQPLNARRVQHLGAGVVVDDIDELGSATRSMLAEGRCVSPAERVQQQLMEYPTPGVALDRLIQQL